MSGDTTALGTLSKTRIYLQGRLTRLIALDQPSVWAILTTPERMAQWLAPGSVEQKQGGAVKLNLKTRADVEAAAKAMAHVSDRVLVEAMQSGIVAEMIIGVTRDPLFGPTLTFGSGGILVELLKDAASLLLPKWH